LTVATEPDSYGFPLTEEAIEVLQELQVIVEEEDNGTHGEALESTIIWYSRMTEHVDRLHFLPPESQPRWNPYTRSLKLHPGMPPVGAREKVQVRSNEATQVLRDSEEMLRLARTTSLEEIIKLRAEYHFRRADGWKVELG
jgi:hypothetical protein